MPSMGNLSPYSALLGMEPRTLFAFAPAPQGRRRITPEDYVTEMTEVYKTTLRYVRNYKRQTRENCDFELARSAQAKGYGVGDFVLV